MGVSLPGDNGPLVLPPSLDQPQLPGTVPVTNTSMYNEATGKWDKQPGAAPPPSPVAAAAAAAPVTPAAASITNADGSIDADKWGAAPATGHDAVPISPEEFSHEKGPGGGSSSSGKPTPGKIHGYKADVDAGVAEAGTGLLGLPVDLATGVLNLPIRLVNNVTGSNIPLIQGFGGAHTWNKAFSYVPGFTNPEDVEDLDAAHAAVRGTARAVAGTLGPGIIGKVAEPLQAAIGPARVLSTGELVPGARSAAGTAVESLAAGATPKAVAAAAVGGGAGGAARSWVPPEWADPVETLVNLGATTATLGATSLAQTGGRGVGTLARTVMPGKGETAINPETGQPFYKAGTVNPETGVGEPIVVTPGAQRTAVGRVAGAMGQTPEQAAATIEAAQGRQPAVPGYQGTAGQITGDTGLLSLERQLQGQERGRVVLADQAAANQRALAAAVQGNAPTEQVQQAAGNYFRSVQAAQRAQVEAEARGLATAAQRDLEATGAHQPFAGDATQGMGAASRETLEGIRQPIKDRFGAAYDALEKGDPNLALDTSPIFEAQKTIRDELGKAGELTASEQKVMDAARDFRGVNKFTDLRSFQKAVSEKLREVGRNPQYGPESPAYRRLSILMDSVDRSMTEAADRYVAANPDNAGHILDRLGEAGSGASGRESNRGLASEAPAGATVAGAQPAGAVAAGEQAGPSNASGNRPVAGVAPATRGNQPGEVGGSWRPVGQGEVFEPGRQFRMNQTTGRSEVFEPAAPAGPIWGAGRKPADINRRIAELGGVKPNSDMRGYDLHKIQYGRLGNPVRESGRYEPDKMREILAQPHEGYLRPGETIDDMVQKMHQSRTPGQEVYPEHYEAQVRAQEALDQEARRTAEARGAASDEIEGARLDAGLRLSNEEHQHAVDLRMHGVDPEEAIRQAKDAADRKAYGIVEQREGMGAPGVEHGASQADMHLEGGRKLVENIKPGDVDTIRELNRGYREYKNDWRTGAIGKVLQRISGGFKLGDSEVPGQLFPKGPKGAEAADQLIKNAGSVEKAQQIIGDYPAKVFRDMALRDGVVTEAGFNAFQKAYGPVLAKFPELQAKFANARAAQATVERAAADHAARLRAFENSAAKAYLGKVEEVATPLKAVQSIMGSDNPAARFRQLMRMAQQDGNGAAVEGIRSNFREWMAKQAGSATEQEGGRPTTFINSSFKNLLKNPDYRAAAKVVLAPDQYAMLFKVADAMDQLGSSANAIAIKGSPGTAADAHALSNVLGSKGFWTNFGRIIGGEAAGDIASAVLLHGGGGLTHGFLGTVARFAGGGAGYLWNAAKARGIRNGEDLALEMVADPNFGKVMLRTAPTNPDSPVWRQTARQMMATSAGLAAQVQGSR